MYKIKTLLFSKTEESQFIVVAFSDSEDENLPAQKRSLLFGMFDLK